MLFSDQTPYFDTCPRCGVGGLEILKTHAYCVNCNYEEIYGHDEFYSIPQWALDSLATKPVRSDLIEENDEIEWQAS